MQAGIYREQMSWENNFTIAPNAWLRDNRISFKAKGLLLYLLSHEIGYNITFSQIERETKDGQSAIRAGIDELVVAGYLEVNHTRDSNGYNAGLAYLLKNPNCENPNLENPNLDNRTAYKKTNIKEEKELRTNIQNEFEQFWEIYPRKQGKADAYKAFSSLEIPFEAVIAGVKRYRDDPNRLPAFTKMPGTWLRAGCWDDEPLPERVLSRDEQKAIQNKRIDLQDDALRESAQRAFAESVAAERRVKADPPKKCEHGRIAVVCEICANNG